MTTKKVRCPLGTALFFIAGRGDKHPLNMHAEVSVIIPVLDDAEALARLLAELSRLGSPSVQVLVVDGGSRDDSIDIARRAGAQVIQSRRGRGQQLNAGVFAADGEWLWMLHTDCRMSRAALTFIRSQRFAGWGRFDVSFEPSTPAMELIAFMMNTRSRLTGICTGDQGIFVHRSLLEQIGGIPEQSLMEDIELSRRLKRFTTPVAAPVRLITSSRRWQRDGILTTILLMWRLRLRYWLGASPEVLGGEYFDNSAKQDD